MGGGGGKSGGGTDRSAELYAQQQADLARQREDQEEKDRLAREAEQQMRDDLRAQMLGQRNMLTTGGEEEGVVAQNVLG